MRSLVIMLVNFIAFYFIQLSLCPFDWLLKCLVMRLGVFRNIFCPLGMEWLGGEKKLYFIKLNLGFTKEGCADQIRFIVPAPYLESCYKFDQFRWYHLLRPASRLHTGMNVSKVCEVLVGDSILDITPCVVIMRLTWWPAGFYFLMWPARSLSSLADSSLWQERVLTVQHTFCGPWQNSEVS